MEAKEKIRASGPVGVIWGLVATLSGLWFVCGLIEVLCRRVVSLHLQHEPYIHPFLPEHYPDLFVYKLRYPFVHSVAFFAAGKGASYMYPAPVGFLYGFFYALPGNTLALFLGFIALSLIVAAVLYGRSLRDRGIDKLTAYLGPVLIVGLAFPVWFEVKQANMEIALWIIVTSGVALFLAGRGYTAAACFGLAASMKIYPVAYLGLFLIRRQYRPIVLGLITAALSNAIGLWYLCPSIHVAWQGVSRGLAEFRLDFMLHKRVELPFDHSLLSLVKVGWDPFPSPEKFAPVFTAYLGIVATVGVVLFFWRIWKLPVTNQITFVTIACILFPPVSFEYTLLHMIVPLSLLVLLVVDAARARQSISGIYAAIVCCVVALSPLSEIIVAGQRVEGQVKAVVLLVLLVVCVVKPFELAGKQESLLVS